MPSRPWFQWYPGDYLVDTLHLSEEEDLLYRRLLDALWIYGPLEHDERQIAKICRIDLRKIRKRLPRLLPLLSVSNGKLDHEKIRRQREELAEISRKRAEAGRKGGKASAKAGASPPRARARPDPDPNKDLNQPSKPISEVKTSTPRASRDGPPAVEWTAEEQAERERLQRVLEENRARAEVVGETLRPAAVTAIAALGRSGGGLKGEEND